MESLVKFESPSTCLVVGPSSSGKSSYVFEVLKHADGVFTKAVNNVYYAYGVYQPLYDEMKKHIANIQFVNAVPTKDMLETWAMQEPGHKLLILDDLMQKASKSEDIVDVFCQYSHHLNFSCWLISQNVFNATKQFRTISLNTHYFALFKCQRDLQQIFALARQLFPGKTKFFMESYRKATEEKYNPLIIDLSPHSNPLYKIRMHVLPGQLMTVFLPEQST